MTDALCKNMVNAQVNALIYLKYFYGENNRKRGEGVAIFIIIGKYIHIFCFSS